MPTNKKKGVPIEELGMKKLQCRILDAEFKEDLGNDEEPSYSNCIFLLLKDLDTGKVFRSFLTAEDLQALTGCKTNLTSGIMVDFATKLRNRTSPFVLIVPEDMKFDEITPDIIKQEESDDNIDDEDEIEDDELSDPVVEKKIDKFSIKKIKKKE